jgi:hypothetical protein
MQNAFPPLDLFHAKHPEDNMTQLAIANEEVGHSFAGMIVTEAGVHPNGSVASIWPRTDDFRSPPINGHHYRASGCLKCAMNRLMHRSK